MKTILALTVAGAALFAAASAANAQDCLGGFRMVKDQIPVTCDEGPVTFQQEPAIPAEPLYTGSVQTSAPASSGGNSAEIPSAQQGGMVFAASREDCKPGEYYMVAMQSMDRPARCP